MVNFYYDRSLKLWCIYRNDKLIYSLPPKYKVMTEFITFMVEHRTLGFIIGLWLLKMNYPNNLSSRLVKAGNIIKDGLVRKSNNENELACVISQSGSGEIYTISVKRNNKLRCTCMDYVSRRCLINGDTYCKHVLSIELLILFLKENVK